MGRRIDIETASRVTGQARAAGKRVVLANGCFDLIHVGHVRYLRGAKAEGDLLVVAVNSDESVSSLKGAGRPLFSEDERAEMVAAMEDVDLVVVFSGDTVGAVIEAIRPDVHCKGTDYATETVPERGVTERVGGETRIVGDPKNHSTRDLIGQVLARFARR